MNDCCTVPSRGKACKIPSSCLIAWLMAFGSYESLPSTLKQSRTMCPATPTEESTITTLEPPGRMIGFLGKAFTTSGSSSVDTSEDNSGGRLKAIEEPEEETEGGLGARLEGAEPPTS